MPAGELRMTPSATANTYTIILDMQSGTEGTETLYEVYANKYYVDTESNEAVASITVPVRSGYKFKGYYTQVEGGGIQVIDENGNITAENIAFMADTTVYAKWIQNRSIPEFTYSNNNYQIVDDADNIISNPETYVGNWKIRFLSKKK